MCKYTKYTRTPIMKFIKLLPASFLAIPFILQLNAQIDCCGLAVGTVIKSPTVQKFVPRNQNFGSRTPALVSPPSQPSLSRTAKASGFSPQVKRQNFLQGRRFSSLETFLLPVLFPMPEKHTVVAVFPAPAFPFRLPRFNRFLLPSWSIILKGRSKAYAFPPFPTFRGGKTHCEKAWL